MSKLPLLNLDDYELHSLSFEPREPFDPSKVVVSQVEVGFRADRHIENAQEFRLVLAVRLHTDGIDEPNLPYALTVKIVGIFTSAVPLPAEAIPQEVLINALTLLYGTCRGFVAQLTGTAVYGKLVLPSVTFSDLVARSRPVNEPAAAQQPLNEPNEPE